MEQLPAIVTPTGELEVAASAAARKAEIEAGFIVALRNPRNYDQVRQEVLRACARPRLAEKAIYRKPIGREVIEGPSIRLLEAIRIPYGHIRIISDVTYDGDDMIKILVNVYDLQRDNQEAGEIVVRKTVERSSAANREIVGERTNTNGDRVYIVRATEDELKNKIGAQKSITIRNCLTRLIPFDLIDEAMDACKATLRRGSGDPDADRKRLCDAFAGIGVQPLDLEAYLHHSLSQLTPKKITDLRVIYASIRDGEATWADFAAVEGQAPHKAVLTPDSFTTTPETREGASAANPSGSHPGAETAGGDPTPGAPTHRGSPEGVQPPSGQWEEFATALKDQGATSGMVSSFRNRVRKQFGCDVADIGPLQTADFTDFLGVLYDEWKNRG